MRIVALFHTKPHFSKSDQGGLTNVPTGSTYRKPCDRQSETLRLSFFCWGRNAPASSSRTRAALHFSDFETRDTDSPKFDRRLSGARRTQGVPLRGYEAQGKNVRTFRVWVVCQTRGVLSTSFIIGSCIGQVFAFVYSFMPWSWRSSKYRQLKK
jgi:hypothetical protein